MNVILYNRDFDGFFPLPRLRVIVERYSHTMNGGPDAAYLRIESSGDNWELTKLLRCPVEIYDGDGLVVWWGYVNRITVPYGDIMIGLGLDSMSNYIAANYSLMNDGSTVPTSQQLTTWASDANSISEYGQKEKMLTVNNATQAQAEGARSTYLETNKYPPPEVELSGGRSDSVRLECRGWFGTLDWKYYANATTSNTATTLQIAAIVTSAGQFLRGSLIENASGIDSNQYRDGTGTGLRCVTELMSAGTSNNRPLLARVDKDRYLHVYERQVEAPEYLMRRDGQLETLLGQMVEPSHCVTAAWVRVKDLPDTLGGLSAMRNFYIESAEYDAERDRCVYRPAGSFEAVRLAKWLGLDETKVKGGSAGGGGGGGISMPYHTHPPSPSTDTLQADYASYSYSNWGGGQSISRGVTITTTTISGAFITIQFTVGNAGVYWVMGNHAYDRKANNQATDRAQINVNGGSVKFLSEGWYEDDPDYAVNNTNVNITAGGVLVLAANDVVKYSNAPNGILSIRDVHFSVIRISS